MVAVAMLLAGMVLVFLGIFTGIPVVVNLPDAWFGAVLAVVLLACGAGLIGASSRKLKQRGSK
jgi:ABC-type multidrug transport system permease subunit